jgi:hypothetical protein
MNYKRIGPVIFAAALWAALMPVGAMALDHLYAIPMSVAGYTGESTLSGFPVLVRLAEGSPSGFSYADCMAGGADIHFVDANGDDIPGEVDTWNTSGTSLVWVRLPSMGQGTQFEMRYGGGIPAPLAASGTWADYDGVWHMNGSGMESTVHQYHGTLSANTITATEGKVGGALHLPGNAQVVTGSTPNSPLAAGFTIEGWVYMDRTAMNTPIARDNFFGVKITVPNLRLTTPAIKDHDVNSIGVGANAWIHLGITFLPSTNNDGLKVYVNGVLAGQTGSSRLGNANSSVAYRFGLTQWSGQSFLGSLDEMRVAPGIRSADWMLAAYETANDAAFVSCGAKRVDASGFVAIVASPSQFGTPSPGYGIVEAEVNESYTFTCPAEAANAIGSLSGSCLGWNLYRVGEASPFRTSSDAGETPLSCTVVYAEPMRLEWLWGDFVAHGWRYDATAHTITQQGVATGETPWILNCTASGTALTVTSVNQTGSTGAVDLTPPVTTADETRYYITAIGNDVFKDSDDLTSLILPDTVLSIGQNACLRCAYLTHVRLSSTLQTIGKCAFMSCTRLRTVTPFVPESVTSVAEQAFRYCNALSSPFVFGYAGDVTYPSSPLGGYAFQQCYALPSASLGPAVTKILMYTFNGCTSLRTVTMHDAITAIEDHALSGCSSLESVTPLTPLSLASLGNYAFFNSSSLAGEAALGTNGVVSLGSVGYQFAGTKITRLIYGPGAPTQVPKFLCKGCTALTVVSIDAAVTKIGASAFESCSALPAIRIPDGVTDIDSCAFLGCTSLTSFEPFLPAACTNIGQQAFHNCSSLAQPLCFATNDLPAALGDYAFKSAGITAATLGDGISAIPLQSFYANSSMKTFRMPANVRSIGGSAFSSCSALESVSPFLPESVTSIGGEAFLACVSLTNDLVLRPSSAITLGTHVFNQCRAIENMTIGTNVTSLPQGFARYEDKLRNVFFEGDRPATWHGNAFMDMAQYKFRFVVPADNTSWTAYVEDSTKATPWVALSAAEQQKYPDAFPGEVVPRAITLTNPAKQWIVSYGTVVEGEKDLVVAGAPDLYGEAVVSPAYGTYTNLAATLSLPLAITAPRYVAEPTTIYACAGYRIETPTASGFGNGVDYPLADPASPSVTYDPQEDGLRRFSWLWEEAGYAVNVAVPDASAGSVAVSGADLQGYFTPGATATVTATPAPGATFVRWHGDVPAGHEMDASITFAVSGPVSLSPEFASPWILSGSGNNMNVADGYWTIKVSGSRDNGIRVGKPTVNSPLGILDLQKPILGGGAFVSVDGSAFKGNTALTELRLPDTLVSIGNASFESCTALTKVTPFLPASVTNIEYHAFCYDANLAGELFFATNGLPAAITGGGAFYGTGITGATLGDSVTSIPGSSFKECHSLGRVATGDAVTSYGDEAFYNCLSLTNVTPFLSSAVTYVGSQLFKCVSSDFVLAPITGDLEIGLAGQNVTMAGYHNFIKTSIRSARFGSGVKNFGGSFMRYSPYLGRVEMTDDVTAIGDAAFHDCASLTNVTPFMPASLTSLGYDAFRDCPKLTGSLRLGTDKRTALILASNTGYQFYNTAITDATVGPGVTTLTTCLFENAKLKSATLQSVSSIGLQVFNLTANMDEFRFAGPAPTTVNANAYKWAADKARLYLPRGEPTWEDWITANVTLWEDLDKATQYIYWDKWPDGRRPVGRTKSTANPANQWVLRWSPSGNPTVVILR